MCPMDHIFQQAHFMDNPIQYGPPLSVREHSFLENPASFVLVSHLGYNLLEHPFKSVYTLQAA